MNVALIQQKYLGDKKSTIFETVRMIKKAAQKGTELIVLQELHQGEYFCITEDVAHFALAETYEEDIAFWSKVAKESAVVLVTSLFEKRAPGLYHNTAIVFEKDGTVAGKYRKMHIPDDPGFYEKFYFTPGDLGFEPIDTSVGRLGVLICWDQWFPEAARLMALNGADILIYPTAIGWFDEDSSDEKQNQLDAWITIQRSHAIANALPLISVNRIGKELDTSGMIDGIHFWGNSFVCGAQGEFIANAGTENKEILFAKLDMKKIVQVRNIWPFFRDRRIESYCELTKRYIYKP